MPTRSLTRHAHRLVIVSSTSLWLVVYSACGGGGEDDTGPTPPAPVATVIVTPGHVNLVVGQSNQLTAQVRDAAGRPLTGRPVTWASSNSTSATVSNEGVVSGVAPGVATVTATSEGKQGTATVTVAVGPVASVEVTPASSSVEVGNTVQLGATARDAGGFVVTGQAVVWTSSASAVASVSVGGLVIGVTPGGPVTVTATIAAKTGSASITVVASTVPTASLAIEFRPAVAQAESPEDELLMVDVQGGASAVELRRPDGSVIPLHQVAGTGRYTTTLTAAEALRNYLEEPSARALRASFLGTLVVTGASPIDRQLFLPVRDAAIPDVMVTPMAADVQRSRHLANIRVDRVLQDGGRPDVVRRFYQVFADDYDFLVHSWLAFNPATPVHYNIIRNATAGLGLPVLDNSAEVGAAGTQRLQGLITFPNNFDHAQAVLSHEIAHCCVNYLKNPPLSTGTAHWPLSSAAFGVIGMGGPTLWLRLTARGDGTYLVERQTPSGDFNLLELYLLGLVPQPDVPLQVVFPPQNVDLLPGTILVGPVTLVSIDDIVASNGARAPAYPESRREFRLATVVVSRGRLLSAGEMAYFDFMAGRGEGRTPVDDMYGRPFFVLTGGRGILSTTIP